jgi:hypothetical protein
VHMRTMIECFQRLWCEKFHQRCQRAIGYSIVCGECGRITPSRNDASSERYSSSLWFSPEMIAHVSSDQMEGFLKSRVGS